MQYGPSVAGRGEGADAGDDVVRPDRSDTIAVSRERCASEAEIALAFRGRARHRSVVSPKGKLVLMQDELSLREHSLSGQVDKPRLVVRMHVGHHDRVDVGGGNAHSVQISQEAPDKLSLAGDRRPREQVGRRYGSRSS